MKVIDFVNEYTFIKRHGKYNFITLIKITLEKIYNVFFHKHVFIIFFWLCIIIIDKEDKPLGLSRDVREINVSSALNFELLRST